MTEWNEGFLMRGIRDALDASVHLDAIAVKCRVSGGVALLFGQVASSTERGLAVAITARVAGVSAVRNELTVRVSGEDGLAPDEQLAERVRVTIAATAVDSSAVVVGVEDHIVRLSGRTHSESDRAVVRHAAGSLSGVVFVENEITIDEGSWTLADTVSG